MALCFWFWTFYWTLDILFESFRGIGRGIHSRKMGDPNAARKRKLAAGVAVDTNASRKRKTSFYITVLPPALLVTPVLKQSTLPAAKLKQSTLPAGWLRP